MRKVVLLILCLSTYCTFYSQSDELSYLEFSFGYGTHGSGDVPGYHYGFNYGEEF